MSKTFTKDDVASHSKGDSLYIVIDEDVYDVTKFQDEHPGMFSTHMMIIEKACANGIYENRRQEKYVILSGPMSEKFNIDIYAVLQRVAGKDASKQFWKYHNEGILKKYKAQLQIGSLDTKAAPTPAPAAPAPKAEPKPQAASGDVKPPATAEPQDPFGELIPFADPSWYQGVSLYLIIRAKRQQSAI
jgi:hypothetical protein